MRQVAANASAPATTVAWLSARSVEHGVLDDIEAMLRSRLPVGRFERRILDGGPETPAIDIHVPQAAADVSPRLPQGCDHAADLGDLQIGSNVVLARHRPVDGDTNVTPGMEPYVGLHTRIAEVIGWDNQGCQVARVDLDSKGWVWRVRDLGLLDGIAAVAPPSSVEQLSPSTQAGGLVHDVALDPMGSRLFRIHAPGDLSRIRIDLESSGPDLDLMADRLPFLTDGDWYSVRGNPSEHLSLDAGSDPQLPGEPFDLYIRAFNDSSEPATGTLRIQFDFGPMPAPTWSEHRFIDLEGESHTLDEWRGKVVVINLWATWCPPCRREILDLIALQARFGEQGLQVVGLTDDSAAEVKAFAEAQTGLNYPWLLGDYEPLARQIEAYRSAIPFTIIVDRSGQIIHQENGRIDAEALERLVQQHLDAA